MGSGERRQYERWETSTPLKSQLFPPYVFPRIVNLDRWKTKFLSSVFCTFSEGPRTCHKHYFTYNSPNLVGDVDLKKRRKAVPSKIFPFKSRVSSRGERTQTPLMTGLRSWKSNSPTTALGGEIEVVGESRRGLFECHIPFHYTGVLFRRSHGTWYSDVK